MCETSEELSIELANKEIDPYTTYKIYYISLSGNRYEARYHRAKYYYYDTVTKEKTNELKNTYHIDYWRCFKNGGAVEIAPNNCFAMIYEKDREKLQENIYEALKLFANHSEEINKKDVE